MNKVVLKVTYPDPDSGTHLIQQFGPMPAQRGLDLRIKALQRGFLADVEYVDGLDDFNRLLKSHAEVYTPSEAFDLGSGLALRMEKLELINRHPHTLLAQRYAGNPGEA